jgi:hypothetical protein
LKKLGLSAPKHLWQNAIYYFLFLSGGIPNSQNNKYAELTASLQGLFKFKGMMVYFLSKDPFDSNLLIGQKLHKLTKIANYRSKITVGER